MRASRLLSIQMLLETRGRMSAQALAGTLEVSLRTLYRDVDQLAAAGVPIYAERGRNGGFQLIEGWKTQLTGFTPSEAQAVFLTGLAGPATQLGIHTQVEGARLKLLAALPAAWRDDAQRISSRFHLDPMDWYRHADPVPHLTTVAAAVWDERQLRIRYESWKDTVERTLKPLGLVLKAGTWYLVAASCDNSMQRAAHKDTPRTYRVSNILSATVTDVSAKRPKKFDLREYWQQSIQRFETELHREHAVVRATEAGVKGLRQLSGTVAKAISNSIANSISNSITNATANSNANASVPTSTRKDGRVTLNIPIESITNATAPLMRLAPDVEVIEPRALRSAVIRRLKASCALYGLATTEQKETVRF